jgi:hypothetical protein
VLQNAPTRLNKRERALLYAERAHAAIDNFLGAYEK